MSLSNLLQRSQRSVCATEASLHLLCHIISPGCISPIQNNSTVLKQFTEAIELHVNYIELHSSS